MRAEVSNQQNAEAVGVMVRLAGRTRMRPGMRAQAQEVAGRGKATRRARHQSTFVYVYHII